MLNEIKEYIKYNLGVYGECYIPKPSLDVVDAEKITKELKCELSLDKKNNIWEFSHGICSE